MGIFSKIRGAFSGSPKDTTANVNAPEPNSAYGSRGGTVPMFKDFPTLSNPAAHSLIYEMDTCFSPLQQLARRCGAFSSEIVGGGERGRAMQEHVVDQSIAINAAQEFLSYGQMEGVRFLWLRGRPVGKWNVLDARDCGGIKVRAGGNFWWDGHDGNNIVRFAPLSGFSQDQKDQKLERWRVAVFKPSIEVNPEGDTRQAVNLLRVAHLSQLLDVAEQVYTERHSLPKEIIKRVMDDLDPDSVGSAIAVGLDQLEGATALKNWSMDRKNALELIEASGRTWQFLEALRVSLRARARELVMSDSEGSGGGEKRDPSSELSDKQIFSVAAYIMKNMAECFSTDVLPFLERINEHKLPPAKAKDPPMVWTFKPPVEMQRITPQQLYGGLNLGIPTVNKFIYEVMGAPIPTGVDPDGVFIYKPSSPFGEEKDDKPKLPSKDGGSEQRPDREEPGSGMEPEPTQDKDGDLRNQGKDK